MAVATLNATVGSATANTYATRTEGTQFDDNRPASSGNDWGTGGTVQEEALLWSCVVMEALIEWTGYRVDGTQILQWPRSGMSDRNDNVIGTTTVPQELKNAQCEFARLLIAGDIMAPDDVADKKMTNLVAGPVELSCAIGVMPKRLPDAVLLLMPHKWIKGVRGRSPGTRSLARA